MAPMISDTHLWVGLGWCGVLAIHKQLILIRTVSEEIARSPAPSPSDINQEKQDAIKLSTLSTLVQSTSPEIRDVSIQIVAERALQSPAVWRLLRRRLRSKHDFKARDQALRILVNFGPGSRYDARSRREESRGIENHEFYHPETFVASIACLCNMLPAARAAETLRQHHSSAEADALWFVHKLLDNNIELALKAGLVRKWLVNYPLTMARPEKAKKEVIGEMIWAYEYSDDYERLLCCVLCDMTERAAARRHMVKYGIGDPGSVPGLLRLEVGRSWGARDSYYDPRRPDTRLGEGGYEGNVGSVYGPASALMNIGRTSDAIMGESQNNLDDFSRGDFRMLGPEYGDEDAPRLPLHERMFPRREESVEERLLRSRRREAMVFAEGGRPIRREDIIESQREEIMDEMVEEELEQFFEETGEVETGGNGTFGEVQSTWLDYMMALRPDGSVRR